MHGRWRCFSLTVTQNGSASFLQWRSSSPTGQETVKEAEITNERTATAGTARLAATIAASSATQKAAGARLPLYGAGGCRADHRRHHRGSNRQRRGRLRVYCQQATTAAAPPSSPASQAVTPRRSTPVQVLGACTSSCPERGWARPFRTASRTHPSRSRTRHSSRNTRRAAPARGRPMRAVNQDPQGAQEGSLGPQGDQKERK
jgi:hypothetical protein